MRGRLTIKASHPSSSKRVAVYYKDNPDPFVFPRDVREVGEASRHSTLIHVEDEQGAIVGVGGVFDRTDGIHDVGGLRVTRNGYHLQQLIMEIAGVTVHLTQERYTEITATTFANNASSIINIEAAGYIPWRNAPPELVDAKTKKADGEPFRLYYAPVPALRQMAKRLLQLAQNPVLQFQDRPPVALELAHPLFTVFGGVLQVFAEAEAADEDQS